MRSRAVMSKRRTALGANASGRRGNIENRRVASRRALCKALKTPGSLHFRVMSSATHARCDSYVSASER